MGKNQRTTLIQTSTRTRPDVDPLLLTAASQQDEKITVVHCIYDRARFLTVLRIWPETCLLEDSGEKRKLLHAVNIDLYPAWTRIFKYGPYSFTLLFEGLSRDCKQFQLREDIPEPGGFYSGLIQRNKTDVYNARLIC